MQGEQVTGCSTILYFVLRHTQHKRIPKKQNLINSAVCPRYNPISATAVHSGCIVCLRGRCLFQIQKKLCFFTEKPQILFIRLKDLCIEQQMLEMKQKEPPASHLWLTEILPSQKGRETVTQTLLYVPVSRQLPRSSSIAYAPPHPPRPP